MAPREHTLPREVFLSHSARDRRFADKVATFLRSHGVPVWYSSTNIVGAQQWHDQIGEALRRCDWFVVVLSPNSVKSRWVRLELGFALRDARYDNRIVPLLLRPCDQLTLSWTLGGIQFVDFSTSFEGGCRNLLRVWGLSYKLGTASRRKK
ncbi:MAG TPA: toll/interleukin-1 receptor domain-containing protein [Terriglobia bacterium]|nr:toll/interleukin-1 receptor domain-containing protein [Terriglobia bacterium]